MATTTLGTPYWPPVVAYYANALYVSWSGSTETRSWLLQTSDSANLDDWRDVVLVKKQGFETAISMQHLGDLGPFMRALAVDQDEFVIGTSEEMDLQEAKAKFLAEEAARARDTWPVLVSLAVVLITLLSLVVCLCSCCRSRVIRWVSRRESGEDDSSSDNDSEYVDEFHAMAFGIKPVPLNDLSSGRDYTTVRDEREEYTREDYTRTWASQTAETARPAENGGTSLGLDLSDTDVSDDEIQRLIPLSAQWKPG